MNHDYPPEVLYSGYLAWEAIPGLTVEESNYIEWLLAGGAPLVDHINAWVATQPAELKEQP